MLQNDYTPEGLAARLRALDPALLVVVIKKFGYYEFQIGGGVYSIDKMLALLEKKEKKS